MNRVRFLHIPKTAGLSFFDTLGHLYAGPRLYFSDDWRADVARFRRLPAAERRRVVLVGGHAPRVTGEPLLDALPTVTLLRDPVRRVQSFCHHVREGKSPYLRETFPPGQFDLDAFLNSGDPQLENLQTKMLVCDRCLTLPDRPADDLAARAVDALMHEIECFGLVERVAESLTLFRRTLGWRHVPPLPRLNARRDADALTFTDAHLERIRELNAIDLVVYRQAAALFEERVLLAEAAYDDAPRAGAWAGVRRLVSKVIRPVRTAATSR